MASRTWAIRLRKALTDHVTVVALLLVAAVLVGGYLTATAYAQDATRTETEQVASWESTASFTHEATVRNGTTAFEEGAVLQNRSSYFRTITPLLNGSVRYQYRATGGGDLRANASVVLVLRSVAETNGPNETAYWRVESPLTQNTVDSLAPGERFHVPFTVNVTAAATRLERIDSQLGTTPGNKEWFVETRLRLAGTRNGRPVETRRTYSLPVSVSGNVYQVEDPGPRTHSGGQTAQREVPVQPSPLRAWGGPLLLVLGVTVGSGLGLASHAGNLAISDRERTWLAYRQARTDFDDWISIARVPTPYDRAATIEVDSLSALVDLAIDTDQRVLEDRERNEYFVIQANQTYTYTPPPSPTESSALASNLP